MGYWVDDPNGQNPPRYVEGFDPAQGQSVEGPGQHTPWWKVALDQSKYYAAPFGAAGLDALTAPVISSLVPSLSVPGGVGSTLLPGSLATSTAVPLSTLVAPAAVGAPLTTAVANAGHTAAANVANTAAAGKTAGTVAGTAAGGKLLDRVLNAAPDIMNAIGQGAAAKENTDAANRSSQNDDTSAFNREKLLDTQNLNQGVQLDLNQREFQNKDYQRNLGNSVYGDLLANLQNFAVTPPPGIQMGQISGGLNVDALPHRQEIGDQARQQAMYNLLHPQELPKIPGPTDLTPPLPATGPGAPGGTAGKVATGLIVGGQIVKDVLGNRNTSRPAVQPNVAVDDVGTSQIYAPASNYTSTQQPNPSGFLRQNATFLPAPYIRR